MQIKDRVILLSKVKYGEADLILKFISATGDVYSAIARSALKSKKRFGGGVLEPTHYMNVTISKRGNEINERLPVLEEAQIIDDFAKTKSDYDRLSLALHFVKAVSTVAREGDNHFEIFNLLGHALKTLESSHDLQFIKIQFDLKLLHLQGVLPPESRFSPFLRSSIRATAGSASSGDELQNLNLQKIKEEIDHMFASYLG